MPIFSTPLWLTMAVASSSTLLPLLHRISLSHAAKSKHLAFKTTRLPNVHPAIFASRPFSNSGLFQSLLGTFLFVFTIHNPVIHSADPHTRTWCPCVVFKHQQNHLFDASLDILQALQKCSLLAQLLDWPSGSLRKTGKIVILPVVLNNMTILSWI